MAETKKIRTSSTEDELRKKLMEMSHKNLVEMYLQLRFDKSIEKEEIYKAFMLVIETMNWANGKQAIINDCEEMCSLLTKHKANAKLVDYFKNRAKEIEF